MPGSHLPQRLHPQPANQRPGGGVPVRHLGYRFPSPALCNQLGQRFRRAVAAYAQANDLPWVQFGKNDDKLAVMRLHLDRQAAIGGSGVAAIGVAQEFQRVWTATQGKTATGTPRWSFYKAAGRRTLALRFGDPRVLALTGALCQTLLAATGLAKTSLRAVIAGLLGSDYRPGQMTYDLRRLRLAGLIRRLPRSNRYTLTTDGIRIAVVYTKVYDRLLLPLTAADQPQASADCAPRWPSSATWTTTPPAPACPAPRET